MLPSSLSIFLLLYFGIRTAQPREISENEIESTNRTIGKRIIDVMEYRTYATPQIIQSRGYPVEIHKVVTQDGYVLEMHRIPGPRLYNRKNYNYLPGRGRVVYIQHCVMCSSGDFVLNGPNGAISFVLADAGFDVWLGNYRGNFYSRNHLYMSPDDKDFWKFSFMEMAHYDIPAMIYYVLEKTGQSNLSYIGHSMGTTGLFASLSLHPEINEKIRVFAAMAPVAYLNHVRGPFKQIFLFARYGYEFLEKINKGEQAPRTKTQAVIAKSICHPSSFFMPLCQSFLPAFSGVNPGYIDEDNIAVVLSHMPAGTSARTLAHFGQLVTSDSFNMFDMGPEENLIHYGQEDAPPFELWKTMIPVGLFWSDNDWVAAPEDVQRIARELPNVALNYRVPQDDFNHLDFLFAESAMSLVYEPMLRFLLDH